MSDFGSSEAGKKGGRARAESLTKEQRSIQARDAALARWAGEGKQVQSQARPQATHDGTIKLANGQIEIQCYVLENGDRVVSTRGMMKALGRAWRGRKYPGTELPVFLEARNLKPFIPPDLLVVPVVLEFLTPQGLLAEGIKADFVPMICETYLRARDANALKLSQVPVAIQSDILMRGFAKVGIIALVDEATGYQRSRARDELAKILEAYVAKEIQKWLKTFDLEFYELICELRGEPLERATKRPQYFGKLTNNLVYQRLAPGVLQKLQEVNPVTETGRRKTAHHRFLTADIGHPKLREHLSGVTSAMKFAKHLGMKWTDFIRALDKTHPKYQAMPLFDREEDGD
jgi:hypothetical protein